MILPNNYQILVSESSVKSPFTKMPEIINIDIITDLGVRLMNIKMNKEFLKGVFKYFYDLYSNGLPFYVQLPPTNPKYTSCISGEYSPLLAKEKDAFYIIVFANVDNEQKITRFEYNMTFENLISLLDDLEEYVDLSAEEMDYDSIDLSYVYTHNLMRQIRFTGR